MRQKIAAKLEPCQTNSDTLCFLISSFLSVMGPDTSMLGGQLPSTAVVQVNQHRWNQKCYFKCIHFQSKFSHNFSQVWEFQHEHQKGKKQNVPTFLLLRLRWYVYVFMYMHLCICIYVYVFMYMYLCICIYVYMYLCLCIYVYVFVYMYLCVNICIC